MKKIIAYLLIALMCVSGLAACGKEKVNEDLQAAVDYVYAMYKDQSKVTANDFERTTQVMIGTEAYIVEWSTDNEAVKVTVKDKIATIDVDEKSEKEVKYTLTATVKDADGNKATKDFKYTVPAFEGFDKIVKDAYALEAGKSLEGTYTLEGVILSVDSPYSADYKNVTVTIQVGDLADYPIVCYRLKDGEGVTAVETIKVGDTITVTGVLKNYNGTIEFDAGCTLDKVVVGEAPEVEIPTVPAGATMEEIVDIAYTLTSGQALADNQTLTGVVKSVDTAYDANYGNVTVTIQVGSKADKLIQCFRMKGTGADKVAVGDTITVTGILKNYMGTIEFDAGCTLDSYTSAGGNTGNGGSTSTPSTPSATPSSSAAEIVNAAYALAAGEALNGTYTLSGSVKSIDYPYSAQYGNVSITMTVDGTDKTLECYRLSGNGADKIKAGDKITVSGEISNYQGKIQFGQGCTIVSYTSVGTSNAPASKDPASVMAAAEKLQPGETLDGGVYTLTGTIVGEPEIATDYGNATFVMSVDGTDGKTITVFRVKGDGYENLEEGDKVTVTGTIINYKQSNGEGLLEFNSGCTFTFAN